MKKELLVITMIILAALGCKQTPSSYVVKGTLPDSSFDGETLYMLRYDDRSI